MGYDIRATSKFIMNNKKVIIDEADFTFLTLISGRRTDKAINKFAKLKERLNDFYSSEHKAAFLDQLKIKLEEELQKHRNQSHGGIAKPGCPYEENAEKLLFYMNQELGTYNVINNKASFSKYKNAYQVQEKVIAEISEKKFSQLIKDFQESYLASERYSERIKKHRNPIIFLNGLLNQLYDYHQKIQFRSEMRDIDEENKAAGYVPTKIAELWEADKELKTLYNSVDRYCSLHAKDFNTIAIHIAEYRAVNKLIRKIRRDINQINSLNGMRMPKINDEVLKKLEDVEAKRKNNKIFCHQCKNETKQVLLFEKGELTPPKEIISFDQNGKRKNSVWTIEARIWKIFKCQGCENINLNVFSRHSPFEDDVCIHHFPTRELRPFPMWATHLKQDFLDLFCEIYVSLNAGNIRLPLMGARTLLDMFIVEKIGDQGTFKGKLNKLVNEKYISEPSRQLLEVALEYGHAAIHRGYEPNKEEINSVLDIIENILHSEALQDKTENLKRTMPTRK